MTHTFLLEPGRWTFSGHWLERHGEAWPIHGKMLVAWSEDGWFTLISKLIFTDQENAGLPSRPDITLQYRGRLSLEDHQYPFVLQHSELGRIEGEGWIGPQVITQRFWVLDGRDRRSGFESMYRIAADRYLLSGGILGGHQLISTLEAIMNRQ
ncbi:hypothetical protein GS597_07850 [Synechococcales cyanobacterium C]|uniref:Uncharacterized protein n=1 Tax=Petrachloros mirabilis ULC683 TaxID=2781853 RepID=A0A8K2A6Y9_9CYAN|nr:hypothetical protein [Petrachloros mirabilis]NCJ06424.1 hypothetical protein [Petrachloros mirabilis ULC683]